MSNDYRLKVTIIVLLILLILTIIFCTIATILTRLGSTHSKSCENCSINDVLKALKIGSGSKIVTVEKSIWSSQSRFYCKNGII